MSPHQLGGRGPEQGTGRRVHGHADGDRGVVQRLEAPGEGAGPFGNRQLRRGRRVRLCAWGRQHQVRGNAGWQLTLWAQREDVDGVMALESCVVRDDQRRPPPPGLSVRARDLDLGRAGSVLEGKSVRDNTAIQVAERGTEQHGQGGYAGRGRRNHTAGRREVSVPLDGNHDAVVTGQAVGIRHREPDPVASRPEDMRGGGRCDDLRAKVPAVGDDGRASGRALAGESDG
jgi:hypothetical protein